MQEVIRYFNHAPDIDRILLFTFVTFFIWNIEQLRPLHAYDNKWRHALYNILFLLAVSPVQFGMGLLVNDTILFTGHHHLGLLNMWVLNHHPLVVFFVGFVLLDLGEYTYHFIMHKIKLLWLIHAVHHIEEEVDVSTTLREHPAETAIRLVFLMLWLLILGVPLWALVLRQFIQIVFNLFSHSNYRFPEKVNGVLCKLFITPNLHHIHHHYEQPYTDMNYGDVLSIWDRMFGTFCQGGLSIHYGVDTFKENKRSRSFRYLMLMPFKKESFRISKKALLLLLALLPGMWAQAQAKGGDALLGKWLSAEKDLEIEVFKSHDKFYGKVLWFACNPAVPPMEDYLDDNNPVAALRTRHWLGMVTLTHLQYAGDGKWDDGDVYDPHSGHTYSATVRVKGANTAMVRGYWGIELLGKTLVFNRVRS